MKFITIAMLLALAAAGEWAVLLAGSEAYYNYRHQSDVAHMYHVLMDHKYDPDHIIVLMVDDLGSSPFNPFPGTIFNHPGNNQRDYHKGLVVDYDGSVQINVELYSAILLGDAAKVTELTGIENPKVLKTTAEDNIFMYYIDHGGDNIVSMPSGGYLTSEHLIGLIQEMHDKKMYNRLVYYLEACESGSMWQKLPKDINAYALSSTVPGESSWGTYCPPDDVVDDKHIGSCLGEVWSCFWLEQDDVADLKTLTLQKQFDDAKEFTTTSHPLQFGDMEIAKDVLFNYISGDVDRRKYLRSENKRSSNWESRENDLLFWKNQAVLSNDKAAYEKYMEISARNLNVDRYFTNLVKKVMGSDDLLLGMTIEDKNWPCYNAVLAKYESTYGFNDYSLKYARTLANMCSMYNGADEDILRAM